MSARRTRGGDLKDSKEEDGGEEAVAMAEAEAMYESAVPMAGQEVASDAADVALNAESSQESKKRRVSTNEEASIEFLDSAKSFSEVSLEINVTRPIDGAAGKVGGGAIQYSATGQASMDESTGDSASEVSVEDDHASADGASVASEASLDDAEVVDVAEGAEGAEVNKITAENFYLLHWLYRIRNVSCLRGLRISFLQPDFLWSIYRPMMRSRKLWRTNGDIRVAANLWCFDRAAAEEQYGHISDWDVSSVTDMSELFRANSWGDPMEDRFRGKSLFNDAISRWDMSNVTDMNHMFYGAIAFNQPVEDWDVSNVTDTNHMFYYAVTFNQPIGNWDVSNVTSMSRMFLGADAFDQPIENWNVTNVTDMSGMFLNTAFNRPVGDWNVSNVTNMGDMFKGASEFNQALGDWVVSKVTNMEVMFCGARAFNQPVGDWDVSKVTSMYGMFHDAVSFDQDLTRWDMSSVERAQSMFSGAEAMQRDNKPATVRDDVYDDSNDDDDDDGDDGDEEGEWEEWQEEAGV